MYLEEMIMYGGLLSGSYDQAGDSSIYFYAHAQLSNDCRQRCVPFTPTMTFAVELFNAQVCSRSHQENKIND